jgi:hypothetical protein
MVILLAGYAWLTIAFSLMLSFSACRSNIAGNWGRPDFAADRIRREVHAKNVEER